MKHRVADLMPPLLDAAVGYVEGLDRNPAVTLCKKRDWPDTKPEFGRCGRFVWAQHSDTLFSSNSLFVFRPSVDWDQAGKIIDAKRIALRHLPGESAEACVTPTSDYDTFVPGRASYMTGPMVMIAAMRAHVHSFSGDEIDMPDWEPV